MSKYSLSRELQVKFLKKIDILSNLSETDLNYLIRFAQIQNISVGKTLFDQGDPGEELHIILAGEIGISIRISGGLEKEISSYTTGSYFGEMSIFENAPRSAKAYAKRDSVLLSLSAGSLLNLMGNHAQTAVLLMHKMLNISTGRLNNTSKFVAEIVRWGDSARERAILDQATGLYNRRYYDEVLTETFAAAEKSKSNLSVVMLDLDHFRQINEIHGHDVGDDVIKHVVEVFKWNVRESDILVRYGGDEFAFLLPSTNKQKAREILEAIRQDAENLNIPVKDKDITLQITISVGIATYPDATSDLKTLCQLADKALYQAKNQGRNRVICEGINRTNRTPA